MFLGHILPLATMIWHPSTDKSAFMGALGFRRRLGNPSEVQDQREPVKLARRQLTHWPWSWLQKHKYLWTPENLVIAPFGFGSVTSTIHQETWEKSHPPMQQEIDIWTLVQAMDPEVSCEPTSDLLAHSLWVSGGGPTKFSQTVDWKCPVTGLQHVPATVCEHSCWHRDPAGNTPVCNYRDPEWALY